MTGDWLIIVVLYALGAAILVAEIFLPSHGILSVAGLGFLGVAVYLTFRQSTPAGYVAIVILIAVLPTMAILAVKYWHRTPVGRRIAPPNPTLTEEDTAGVRLAELQPLVGQVGQSLTPLRPVGTCEFNGRRVECVAEMGMIERGTTVEAVGIRNRTLVVRPCDHTADEQPV